MPQETSTGTKDGRTPSGFRTVPRARRTAVLAFAFSGMAALIYEVAWTRELSLVFGSTIYAVSMMLAAFMSGLSLGALVGGRWADRTTSLLALFARLEFGIGIFGLISLPLIQALPTAYFVVYETLAPSFGFFFILQLLLSFVIMLVPTTLMGATFPVVARINAGSIEEVGRDVGSVYSINTLGSIAGSIAGGFLLIPFLGVKTTVFVAATLNVAVATGMLWFAGPAAIRKWLPSAASLFVVAGLAATLTGQQAYSSSFYTLGDFESLAAYRSYRDSLATLFLKDDVHGRVSVIEHPDGRRSLLNSGKAEGSDTAIDLTTTRLLALLPVASAEDPDSVLIIGLGTGYTSRHALDLPVGTVDTVEINEAVVEASRLFVGDRVEGDPRSRIVIGDARNYLSATGATYDVVSSQPSYPLSTHVSHLFTREFYGLVRGRLADDGVYCQWIPRYLLHGDDTQMMIKTFGEVFPNTYVWGVDSGGIEALDILLIGVNGDRALDTDRIERTVAIEMGGGLEFALYGAPADVSRVVDDPRIPVNTDDRPLLEFVTPRNQIDFINGVYPSTTFDF